MSAEALARALCARASHPGYCDLCERTSERILADPAPLLAALAEAGVLREERGHMGYMRYPARRYVTDWEPQP